jgi:hypothetical protein
VFCSTLVVIPRAGKTHREEATDLKIESKRRKPTRATQRTKRETRRGSEEAYEESNPKKRGCPTNKQTKQSSTAPAHPAALKPRREGTEKRRRATAARKREEREAERKLTSPWRRVAGVWTKRERGGGK